VNAIACASPTSRVALGHYDDQAGDTEDLIATNTPGSCRTPRRRYRPGLPAAAAAVDNSATCISSTLRLAIGEYLDRADTVQGVALTDTSGIWSAAKAPLPPGVASNPPAQPYDGRSCASSTSCAEVDGYAETSGTGLLLSDSSGTWSASARPPGKLGPGGRPGNDPPPARLPSASTCVVIGESGNGNSVIVGETSSAGSCSAPSGAAGTTPDADFDLAAPAGAPTGTLATTVVVLTVCSGPCSSGPWTLLGTMNPPRARTPRCGCMHGRSRCGPRSSCL
jgi:hypothetical protein